MCRNLRKPENFYYGATQEIIHRARNLRKSMTKTESMLWERLRRKQLNGVRFRRQHPISRFIVDFYCHDSMLVIEIDGEVHKEDDQQERDINRTYDLESFGLKVIRFTNNEILYSIEKVLSRIENYLAT